MFWLLRQALVFQVTEQRLRNYFQVHEDMITDNDYCISLEFAKNIDKIL